MFWLPAAVVAGVNISSYQTEKEAGYKFGIGIWKFSYLVDYLSNRLRTVGVFFSRSQRSRKSSEK